MFMIPAGTRALNNSGLPNGSIARSQIIRFAAAWFRNDIIAMTQQVQGQVQAPAHIENNAVIAAASQAIERLIAFYVPARIFVCIEGQEILDSILGYMCVRKGWVLINLNPPGFTPLTQIIDEKQRAETAAKRIKKMLNTFHPLGQNAETIPVGQGYLVNNLP